MSKDFKQAAAGIDSFFSAKDEKTNTTAKPEKKEYYRLNLKLDIDLKDYLADEAWLQRTSITALVNKILTEYMENHGHNKKIIDDK